MRDVVDHGDSCGKRFHILWTIDDLSVICLLLALNFIHWITGCTAAISCTYVGDNRQLCWNFKRSMLLAAVNFEESFLHLLHGFHCTGWLERSVLSRQLLHVSQTNDRIWSANSFSNAAMSLLGWSSAGKFGLDSATTCTEASHAPLGNSKGDWQTLPRVSPARYLATQIVVSSLLRSYSNSARSTFCWASTHSHRVRSSASWATTRSIGSPPSSSEHSHQHKSKQSSLDHSSWLCRNNLSFWRHKQHILSRFFSNRPQTQVDKERRECIGKFVWPLQEFNRLHIRCRGRQSGSDAPKCCWNLFIAWTSQLFIRFLCETFTVVSESHPTLQHPKRNVRMH